MQFLKKTKMVNKKIPEWQIKKNILDLEYRDLKENINNCIIILATLSIGFVISFLQNSFSKEFLNLTLIIFLGIFSIFLILIFDYKQQAKEKLDEINKIKNQ